MRYWLHHCRLVRFGKGVLFVWVHFSLPRRHPVGPAAAELTRGSGVLRCARSLPTLNLQLWSECVRELGHLSMHARPPPPQSSDGRGGVGRGLLKIVDRVVWFVPPTHPRPVPFQCPTTADPHPVHAHSTPPWPLPRALESCFSLILSLAFSK